MADHNYDFQQHSSDQLKLLMDLIGRINSTQDLQSLLAAIMESAKTIMDAEASSLMLLDEKTDELVITMPTGPATADISGKRLPRDKGIGGWVLSNLEPQIVNDVTQDERFLGDITDQNFKTRNLICVPLCNREGEPVGVLQAINRKNGDTFEEKDVAIFKALANQAAISIEKARLQEEALQKQLYEQQLETARSIQKGFWPDQIPEKPGYDIAGNSSPAWQVGGDYYDFIPTKDADRWGFVIADVTGKGIAAALLMATIRAAIRTQIENRHPVKETIELVNQTLFKDTPIDKFVTLFYGELDFENDTFTYVNAGHNPPLVFDTKEGVVDELSEGGTLIGIQESSVYNSRSIDLKKGQSIVLYTDGITEAQNEAEEQFGEDRLKIWLKNHQELSAKEVITKLQEKIADFRSGDQQEDDTTMIVIRKIAH